MTRSSIAFLYLGLFACSVAVTACGDDGDGGGGSGADNAGGDNAGGDNAGGDNAGGDNAGGDNAGGGGGGQSLPVACGDDLTCDAGDVCIVEPNEPACTDLGKGEMCPKGTTETNCGGAGIPCCCGPTPPDDHRCLSAAGCGDATPTCECLDPCEGDEQCSTLAQESTFQCEPPPKP